MPVLAALRLKDRRVHCGHEHGWLGCTRGPDSFFSRWSRRFRRSLEVALGGGTGSDASFRVLGDVGFKFDARWQRWRRGAPYRFDHHRGRNNACRPGALLRRRMAGEGRTEGFRGVSAPIGALPNPRAGFFGPAYEEPTEYTSASPASASGRRAQAKRSAYQPSSGATATP